MTHEAGPPRAVAEQCDPWSGKVPKSQDLGPSQIVRARNIMESEVRENNHELVETTERVAMRKRLGIIGMLLVVVGFVFVVAGGVAFLRVQDGYDLVADFVH